MSMKIEQNGHLWESSDNGRRWSTSCGEMVGLININSYIDPTAPPDMSQVVCQIDAEISVRIPEAPYFKVTKRWSKMILNALEDTDYFSEAFEWCEKQLSKDQVNG